MIEEREGKEKGERRKRERRETGERKKKEGKYKKENVEGKIM